MIIPQLFKILQVKCIKIVDNEDNDVIVGNMNVYLLLLASGILLSENLKDMQ